MRWMYRRRAELVKAVDNGLLSLDNLFRQLSITPEEFESWRHLIDQAGVQVLRTTKLHRYRSDRPTPKPLPRPLNRPKDCTRI
jgi:Protein of unknown function (DUF1153)